MKTYKDLTKAEQRVYNKIRDIFFMSEALELKNYIKVLAVLLNSYKARK